MLDDETVIIPGHGRPMCRQDIFYSIRYIEELNRQVDVATERGLSLEQAQQEVRMEDYSDYSMYEFIHFEVNIPAVFDETSA